MAGPSCSTPSRRTPGCRTQIPLTRIASTRIASTQIPPTRSPPTPTSQASPPRTPTSRPAAPRTPTSRPAAPRTPTSRPAAPRTPPSRPAAHGTPRKRTPLTPAPTAPGTGTPTTPPPLRPVPAPQDPTPLGADAARWALLYPAGHDRPRIDAGHLLQRESNPLFRVRYAHARTRALTRNAAALGFTGTPGDVPGADDLLGALAEYPRALRVAATHRAPDRVARQLVTTADAFLALQHLVLPLGDEKPSAAHRARLALAEATGTVLAGGLSLLGISAPDYL
ncbi:DALR anticodon-binding domain-containing protein [Streptomyces sp. LN325]|uniref:DALR anticodon-binding domain-containing protein n=1 Tax=Streptomyces sp. LN325 TaxID=3112976 RepID=UPI003722B8B7